MNKNKLLYIILPIIILFAGGIVYFKFVQNQSTNNKDVIRYSKNKETINFSDYNTSGWTTYNSSYGYKIMYKPSWIARKAPEGISPSLEEYNIYPKEINFGPASLISVDVSTGTIESYLQDIRSGKKGTSELTRVTFNNHSALKQNIDGDSDMYILENDGYLYFINFNPDARYETTKEEEMSALASFDFTK